jgi:protein involved in polysaccharide export with SLBB domain
MLAGCARHVPLPEAAPGIAARAPAQYVIGADDVLKIHFQYNPAFDQSLKVQPDGRITLPMIGGVLADGQTPSVLAAALTQAYTPYFNRPDIDVIVTSALSQQVFVGGEVAHAGPVGLQPGMTITAALIGAGGLKDTAAAGGIVLLRRDGAGTMRLYKINVREAMNGSDLRQNIPLQPHDVIVAPKSGIANVNLFITQYIKNNIPITIGGGLPI